MGRVWPRQSGGGRPLNSVVRSHFMRLSEQPEYLIAIPAVVDGDYETARRNLDILLERGREQQATEQVAYLLHVLGDVEARAGNVAECHSLHSSAIEMFPDIPLSYIHYATGLLKHLRDRVGALGQLERAESLLGTERWRASGDDLPRHWYEEEIQKLRSEASGNDF
jgi:predicted Zn-dependent protease